MTCSARWRARASSGTATNRPPRRWRTPARSPSAFSPASPRRARAPCARCGTRARRTNACARASAKPSSGSPQPRIPNSKREEVPGSARDAETKASQNALRENARATRRVLFRLRKKSTPRARLVPARARWVSPSTPISSVSRCCTRTRPAFFCVTSRARGARLACFRPRSVPARRSPSSWATPSSASRAGSSARRRTAWL